MNKTLIIIATTALLSSACSDKKKSEPTKSASTTPAKTGSKDGTKAPADDAAKKAIATLFSGKAPTKASAYLPAIQLGMKFTDAEKIRNDGAKLKTDHFQLGYVASDDVTIDSYYYVHLPKDGMVELGDAAWGSSVKVSTFKGDMHFWLNSEDGVRASARYDEKMDWTMLSFDHYLAAENFAKSGLFVFENGSSLLGKAEAEVAEQLTRSDYNTERKTAFIPPTAYAETSKVILGYGDDGKSNEFSFSLEYVDDAHKDRLMGGLTSGLGEAKTEGEEHHFTSEGRLIVVKNSKQKLKVKVTMAAK